MSEEELLRFVSEMEGAYYDYPFDEDFETAIFRRKDTKKWFGALLYAPNDKLSLQPKGGKTRVLNVKVPPELGVILKENYAGVLNAYQDVYKRQITRGTPAGF